jgi:hypothetical protein
MGDQTPASPFICRLSTAFCRSSIGGCPLDLAGVKPPAYVCNSGKFSNRVSARLAIEGRPAQR